MSAESSSDAEVAAEPDTTTPPPDTDVPADSIVPPTEVAIDDTAPAVDAMAACANAILDPGESDVDCGGPVCEKCGVGRMCTAASDCMHGVCNVTRVCAAPSCTDGVVNGPETDVDCGGPVCPRCIDSRTCLTGIDCQSGICTAGRCAPPTCSDGVRNGTESDVDCGGACTNKCKVGQRCFFGADCSTRACIESAGSARCECPTGMSRVNVPISGGTYCIDRAEVTNEQYVSLFLATGPSVVAQPAVCAWNTSFVPTIAWPAPVDRAGYPVRGVDWCDARMYCEYVGKRLCGAMGGGATPFAEYADHTKSQWHNACSQGVLPYPYGSSYGASSCNGADAGRGDVYEVLSGSTFVNTSCYGGPLSNTYQLSGNVAEWEDACSETSGASDACLVRGGSFLSTAADLRCDAKRTTRRDTRAADVGFRCCVF